MPFLILFFSTALLVFFIYQYLLRKLTRHRPQNFPQKGKITHNKEKITVICVGDSITHGNVSANYVEMLERWLGQDYFLYNAGVNSDLTYTLLRRLEDVITTNPDFIILLIGTNDLNATLSKAALRRYRQFGKIQPEEVPCLEDFQRNYTAIVQRLKKETKAAIMLLSLPVISEDLREEANQQADRYSKFIKELSEKEELRYVPVRETMKAYLRNHPKKERYQFKDTIKLMYFSIIRHELLGQDWNTICAAHNRDLTQDNLHFNTRGAAMIASLVEQEIINYKP
ncbi:MAG: SGNH/GDSL hydrolase family protein [Spirosomataceae bacterium]